ncbi:mucin-13 isoform X16 [Gallus gallus]|uniref:mucin-13 isoform X15 n=1 Tax=Gallus gallus TaxID=9031 RepID=UPI001AE58539|nr:mucin-13 isoform X15 [Gallus gallus]XP_040531431.1 mucin-13 isoform X16 [Gallus gallus]
MGRCMFFTVLLCLVLSLSEGTTSTIPESSSTIAAVQPGEGNESEATENSTASPPSPLATGNESKATENSTESPPSPVATGNESARTDNSTVTPSSPVTAGNESAGTENSTATPSSPVTAGNESAGTENSTATPSSPVTAGNESAGTENSTATPSSPVTAGNESAGTENSTVTPSSPVTAGNESAGTENSTATPSSPVTAGNESAGTENSTVTPSSPVTAGNESAGTENSTVTPSSPVTAGGTSTTTLETSTTSPTPAPEELCKPNPCGGRLSTCVPLNTTHICQCPYGFYYYNNNCYTGKVFPGIITLEQMLSSIDVNSAEYERMVQNITEFFKDAFENMTDYKQTVIVKVDFKETAPGTRSANYLVNVTVMNIFTENTNATYAEVQKAVRTAADNLNYVRQYANTSQCAVYPCDDATTTCEDGTYPACVCKEDFTKTAWDTYSCSGCADCSAEANKFCDRQSGIPECKCMDNFKADGGRCVRCPVGYSGENCENNKELILIIVGTVFGAIILCLVVAVSVVSVRAKHSHDPEKKRLIKPGNSNSNNSEETRIFPRVQTTSGHANPGYQPNNPYEVHSSSRGDFVEKDYDDLYEISRQPEGFRMQRR